MNVSLLTYNFARVYLLELRKCTITEGVTYVTPYW